MEELSLRDIASALGCQMEQDRVIREISSDSRHVPAGCLFLALQGDRFDGHDYVTPSLEAGAAAAVVMQEGPWPPDRILRVADTRQAYLDIAGLYRRQRGIPVVAITGSVGKTTTKEMVACVVSAAYRTLKTKANLNNEIGLSQTILGITVEHEAAVLELGMDGPGQIAPLSRAAAPQVAVLTNIGVSHLEALGSRENILREKLDITAGMADGGVLVLNADDDLLARVQMPRLQRISYGIRGEDAMVRAEGVRTFSTHTSFEIRYNGRRYDAQVPAMGEHNVYNALAAFCVGIALEIEPHQAIAALRDYEPTGMRQNVVNHCGFTVVEDCYNASPDSVKAAMKTLGSLDTGKGRRIAILSDMLELGSLAAEAHRDCGVALAQSGVDMVFCAGELSRFYYEGARAAGMEKAWHFDSKEELFEALQGEVHEEDVLWVKASRGMKLEDLLSMIYKTNF